MLIDSDRNSSVLDHRYDATLDDIESFLND